MNTVNIVFKKVTYYFVVILLFMLVTSFVRSLVRTNKTKDRIQEAKDRVEDLKEENRALETELEFVRSEEFTERQIRDKLGLAKEGEIVVILPEDEVVRKLAPVQYEEEEVLPDPNWKKWMKLFL